VPVHDVSALAAVTQRLIEQPDLIATMGRESRRIAEVKYDVHRINQRILEVLDLF
jgi:glycosyltransferase involved in cell wall biosynthesis